MSLIFMDGFDHYGSADILKKWTAMALGTGSVLATSGRRAGGCINTVGNGSVYLSKTLGVNAATLIAGFAFSPGNAFPTTSTKLIEFFDGTTTQADVRVNVDGTLSATRNGTVLGASTAAIAVTGFNYVEVKYTFHNTAGAVEIRLNGASVLSLTGVNTRNATNAYANVVRLGQYGSASSNTYFDDFYICDNSGTTNNGFLGDVRIDTLLPNGDGTYSQFTPSTGTTHYTLVDESAPNTTDYNDGLNVGDRDSYAMGNLQAIASQIVYAIQVHAAVMKDDAGTKSAAVMVRSGGVNADGVAAVLSTSQGYISKIHETNPNGSVAWTEASVNALEAGVVVTA